MPKQFSFSQEFSYTFGWGTFYAGEMSWLGHQGSQWEWGRPCSGEPQNSMRDCFVCKVSCHVHEFQSQMLTCISISKPTMLILALGWCHLYKQQLESLRRQGLWSLVLNIAMFVSKQNFKDIIMKKPHFKELDFREDSCYKAKETQSASQRLLYHLFCC